MMLHDSMAGFVHDISRDNQLLVLVDFPAILFPALLINHNHVFNVHITVKFSIHAVLTLWRALFMIF